MILERNLSDLKYVYITLGAYVFWSLSPKTENKGFEYYEIFSYHMEYFFFFFGIFSFNCSSALGFKHVGHSFIHFLTLWLKIL